MTTEQASQLQALYDKIPKMVIGSDTFKITLSFKVTVYYEDDSTKSTSGSFTVSVANGEIVSKSISPASYSAASLLSWSSKKIYKIYYGINSCSITLT